MITTTVALKDAFTFQVTLADDVTGPVWFTTPFPGLVTGTIIGPSAWNHTITITSVTYDHPSLAGQIFMVCSEAPIPGATYTLTVNGVIGPVNNPTVTFACPPSPRLRTLRNFMPTSLNTDQPVLNALLTAIAYVDEYLSGSYYGAAGQMRYATTMAAAVDGDLERVAGEWNVVRPSSLTLDDDTFRRYAAILGPAAKAIEASFVNLLNIMIGPGWAMYDLSSTGTAGTVTVEYPPISQSNSTGTQAGATYLRDYALTPPTSAPQASTGSYFGDYLWGDEASDAVGQSFYLFVGNQRQIDTTAALGLIKATGIVINAVQRTH